MTTFLLIWLMTQAISVLLVWFFTFSLGRLEQLETAPAAVVIVAVKGHHAQFDHFLTHLFAQDYPAYRVVFAVESADDTAIGPIEAWSKKLPGRIEYVIAGPAQDEGQKITNLRAGIARVATADDIVVFADSDIRPSRDWLVRLIAPLMRNEAEIVSGFAWLVVDDRAYSTAVMASMAATMVTVPRLPFLNAAWGGSTALRRDTFEALDLNNAWRGTLCDDLHLTVVAQQAGLKISAPREMLQRLFVTTKGFDDVAEDALRWLMMFRIYMPVTYILATFGLTFAALGWIVALLGALALKPTAIAALVAALVLAIFRTMARAVIVARLWGRTGLEENRRYLLLDPWITPIAAVMNAACSLLAMFKRQTTWAGITYEIDGPKQVKLLARRPSI